MSNIILPIAIWAAIGLGALSLLVMATSGLRSVWYGKVELLTIAVVAFPGVLVLVLASMLDYWSQAGIYTLAIMFGLLLLGLLVTGLRQVYQNAFR